METTSPEIIKGGNILFCYDKSALDQRKFVERFKSRSVNSLFDEGTGTELDTTLNDYLEWIEPESVFNLIFKKNSNQSICDFSNKNFNFDTVVEAAKEKSKSKGINAIFVAPHVNSIRDSISLIKSIKDSAELKDTKIFSSPTLFTNQTLLSGEKSVLGVTMAVSWFPGSSQGKNSIKFEKDAINLWVAKEEKEGEKEKRIKLLNKIGVTWRSVGAYNATNAIVKGLNGSISRDSLSRSLSSKEFELTDGIPNTIKFYNDCKSVKSSNDSICVIGKMISSSGNEPKIVQIEREKEELYIYKFQDKD